MPQMRMQQALRELVALAVLLAILLYIGWAFVQ
jgi:hypothetical protein